MNTIIISGANGFLGKNILSKFDLKNVLTLSRQNANIICDLSIQTPVLPSSDLVIHTAGKAHMGPKTDKDSQVFFNVNVTGTQNLLNGLALAPSLPKSFVFISSLAVYGLYEGKFINEKNALLSKDPYGLSKIQAEKLVQEWCKQHNIVCTILRLPLVVGANPPGNLGAMIRGIDKGYYFNVAGGNSKKSMVLAEDVAKIIMEVAKIGGIYNLTDGYHPTFAEISNNISIQLGKGKPMNIPSWLARIIAKFGDLLGSKAPLNTNKLKKITSDLTFDDSKAREAFGWNPTPVLEGFKINLL